MDDQRDEISEALAYQRQGAHAKAIKIFNPLVKAEPKNFRWLLLRAVSYQGGPPSHAERAVTELAKAISVRPSDVRPYLVAVPTLHQLQLYDTALAYTSKAVELDPSPEAYASRAHSVQLRYSQASRVPAGAPKTFQELHEGAVADLKKAIELSEFPKSEWYFGLGKSYEALGNEELSMENYQMRPKLEREEMGSRYERTKNALAVWWRWLQTEELGPTPNPYP
jgi:tetratricopeptide (TPR) repeat protein